jgi:predicted nucleic acid-binding protein
MKDVFLDTGYVLALQLLNDQNHEAATRHWGGIVGSLPTLVTTSYVFDEVVTFLNSRGLHAKAVSVGNILLSSPAVNMIHVDRELFQAGWAWFQRHQDKWYSLTDCISFVVMERLGISRALTFDRHFVHGGFQKLPED